MSALVSMRILSAETAVKNTLLQFHSERDGTDAVLKVSKKNSDMLTYKVAIKYLGLSYNRPHWELFITKDENPELTQGLKFLGSASFSFKAADESCIRISTVDELKERVYYHDLTFPTVAIRKYLPFDIRRLILTAKEFVKQNQFPEVDIYYNHSVVICGVHNESLDLYVAELGDSQFVKCELSNTDEYLNLNVQFKGNTHKLRIPPADESDTEGLALDTLGWDDCELRIVKR